MTDVKAGIRMLVLALYDHEDTDVVIYPVPRECYTAIEQTFKIDSTALDAIVAEGFLISEFRCFENGAGVLMIRKKEHLVMTYDPAAATTYVLAGVVCSHEAIALTNLVTTHHQEPSTFAFIAFSWITQMLPARASAILYKKRRLLRIERKMGIFAAFDTEHSRLKRKGFLEITQELMLLKNSSDESALDFYLDVLNTFSTMKIHFELPLLATQGALSPELRVQVSQLRSIIRGLQTLKQEIVQRADIVLQTVSSALSALHMNL